MNQEVLKKIFSYIDEHINEKVSLLELAKIAGYSPFYFSKLFSESVGMSVTGYIRVRKLQYALSSLLNGEKVLDVAFKYAFDSHEGFTRSFTKLFGTTPSKVRKYLTSYNVPPHIVPAIEGRRMDMGFDNDTLIDNMHQLVFEVIRTSLEEVKEGFCTEINVTLFADGRVKIADNGRGIPLSKNEKQNQKMLDSILSGHPISTIEYERMGDFIHCGLQTVNSLCESLQVNVYRAGKKFSQNYVRGIAQHDIICSEEEHPSGMEILLKPDTAIFRDIAFSSDMIREWADENMGKYNPTLVNISRVNEKNGQNISDHR